MQNNESFPLTHAVYTKGSCYSAQDAINKIKQCQEEFGYGKYINFVGMPISDLPQVQEAFPYHVIENTAGQWSPYYEVKPKIQQN